MTVRIEEFFSLLRPCVAIGENSVLFCTIFFKFSSGIFVYMHMCGILRDLGFFNRAKIEGLFNLETGK